MKTKRILCVVICFLTFPSITAHMENMIFIKGGDIIVNAPYDKQLQYFKDCDPSNYKYMLEWKAPLLKDKVNISVVSFYIDKYPVSMNEYLIYCKVNKVIFPNELLKYKDKSYPMIGITWHEANSYCSFYKKRLPTKYEYEFLMYRNDFFPFDIYNNLTISHEINEPCKNMPCHVIGIGENKVDVNPLGVVDIYSNMEEWTSDNACNLRQTNYASDQYTFCKKLRITKKAAFNSDCSSLYIFNEPVGTATQRYSTVGFRCALDNAN